MADQANRFVTVATFQYPIEAHLAKSKLESEGIEACIADENIVAINWLYSNAVGGVKLQVRESDAKKARNFLLPVASGPNVSEVVLLPCPKCHSRSVSLEVDRRPAKVLLWLFFLFPVALFRKRRWRCAKCHHTVSE
jgi:hypothetical protein